MSAQGTPRRGNPKIRSELIDAAESRRAATDDRIAAAKVEIEALISVASLRAGDVTFQMILKKAGLTPTFLEKKTRRTTKESLRVWIEGLRPFKKRRSASAGTSSGSTRIVGDEASSELDQLREDFVKLQTSYVLDHLKGIAWRRAYHKSKVRIDDLESVISGLEIENTSLKGKLKGAGIPN